MGDFSQSSYQGEVSCAFHIKKEGVNKKEILQYIPSPAISLSGLKPVFNFKFIFHGTDGTSNRETVPAYRKPPGRESRISGMLKAVLEDKPALIFVACYLRVQWYYPRVVLYGMFIVLLGKAWAVPKYLF